MKIINDYLKLKWQRKIQAIILLLAICFFASEYNTIYLEQKTPCDILGFYNKMPLPNCQSTIINVQNHRKMSVFTISLQVNDPEKYYEIILRDFLDDNGFQQDLNKYFEYYDDTKIVYAKREGNKIIINLTPVMRGVFDAQKNNK